MDFIARVVFQPRIVHYEAELREILGDLNRRGLLAFHPYSECLDSAEKEERIKGCEGIANRIYDEGDFLMI
jgi:hypothetical protein